MSLSHLRKCTWYCFRFLSPVSRISNVKIHIIRRRRVEVDSKKPLKSSWPPLSESQISGFPVFLHSGGTACCSNFYEIKNVEVTDLQSYPLCNPGYPESETRTIPKFRISPQYRTLMSSQSADSMNLFTADTSCLQSFAYGRYSPIVFSRTTSSCFSETSSLSHSVGNSWSRCGGMLR